MASRSPFASAVAAAVVLGAAISGAQAHDESKYPAFEGAWARDPGPPRYDPSRPDRRGQQPPLKPEYQAIFEASLADQALGGQGNNHIHRCIPVGMPRQAASGFPIEILITGKAVVILYESSFSSPRKIHTDGRAWPKQVTPTFAGYSIGQWLDTDGDGTYDTLEIETRHMKGPRAVDNSGIPLHEDNATVVKDVHSAEQITTPSARQALYNTVQTDAAQDAFMAFLYYSPYAYVTTSNVHGFFVTPLGNYHMQDVWLSK